MSVDSRELRQIMITSLTSRDVDALYRLLNLNGSDTEPTALLGRIRRLTDHMQRESRIPELLDALAEVRPDIFSKVILPKSTTSIATIGSGGVRTSDRNVGDNSIPIEVPAEALGNRVVNIESDINDPRAATLLEKSVELTDSVVRLGSPSAQAEALELLLFAQQSLRTSPDQVDDWPLHLSKAEDALRRVQAVVYSERRRVEIRVQQFKQRDNEYRREISIERRLNWLVPLIMGVYVVIIAAIAAVSYWLTGIDYLIPVVGIPISIIIWAFLGGISAVLYRYYKRQSPASAILETRYVIARPFVGAITGIITYFAITSGLFLLTGGGSTNVVPTPTQGPAILVLVWLIAFSDYVFEKVIVRLAGNLSGDQAEKTLISISEVPETEIAVSEKGAGERDLEGYHRLIAEQGDQIEELKQLLKEHEQKRGQTESDQPKDSSGGNMTS